MEKFPKTLLEFQDRFATEDACRAYLEAIRWPDGFKCPRCGHAGGWRMSRGLYLCRQCRHQASVTAGTIFERTRKPLRQWFQTMWFVTNQKHGVSALGLQNAIGFGSYHTAWTWLHKLRKAMVRPGRDKLSGLVEADEIYIGGEHEGPPGRGDERKALVLVAAEIRDPKGIGRIRLKRVEDATMMSLHDALSAAVQLGSTIRTDGWTGYNNLEMIGFDHDIARHEGNPGENLLPAVNRIASLLKRWLLGTHQGAIQNTHLDYYLDEFTFRFNRRTSKARGQLFFRLVKQALEVDPWPAKRIRGGVPLGSNTTSCI